jgi:hypothetical protein
MLASKSFSPAHRASSTAPGAVLLLERSSHGVVVTFGPQVGRDCRGVRQRSLPRMREGAQVSLNGTLLLNERRSCRVRAWRRPRPLRSNSRHRRDSGS